MKQLLPLLLIATVGCSSPKQAPQHVRTVKDELYYLDSLKSINRAAIVRDSLENERGMKP
jgi:hypothetical protein